MSTAIDSLPPRDQLPAERRFYPRVAPRSPVLLSFSDQNVGTILNLSENGLLVSTPAALELNSVCRVSLQLGDANSPISLYLHTVWSDPACQKSGLQFLDLGESDRATLRAWSAQQLGGSSEASAPAPVTQTSVWVPLARNAKPSSRAVTELFRGGSTPRGPWLSALEHHRRVPIRYFWASFAATLFLGAAWATVEGFFPDKILKAPVAHLRSARHATHDAPATTSAIPSAVAAAKPTTIPWPVAPIAKTALSENSATSSGSPHISPANKAIAPPSGAAPSPPMSNRPSPSQRLLKKVESAPQISARASAPAAVSPAAAKPATPSVPDVTVSASAPGNPSAVANNPYPRPLNPQPIAPKPAVVSEPYTDSAARQPVFAPQPSAPRAVAPPPAYSPQILEIPSMAASAYVQLPGERVVRSPHLTMHIQRSVWVKAGRWFWHSRKKVNLGELAARVDPQLPRFAPGYGKPEYGSITVLATVAKNGEISSVRPLYGSAQLLPSVSTALHSWRYQPTYVDDQPVETLARIEVDFHAPDQAFVH